MTNKKLYGKFTNKPGKTKALMLRAPRGCIYIWCSSDIRYPRQLAESIGRQDLKLVSPSWLLSEETRKTKQPVMLDHATTMYFTEVHRAKWEELVDRGKGIL